jgi:hypothetical protein
MKKLALLLSIPLLFAATLSCSAKKGFTVADSLKEPDEVHIFTVPLNSLERELADGRSSVVKGFPFISFQSAIDFRGKFPPEFYAPMQGKWKAGAMREVDYWRLQKEPSLYDVIYMGPLWFQDLRKKGDDLLENIAYSFNIPKDQLAILDGWIRNGGILWLEPGLYISTYDYRLNRYDDKKLDELVLSLKRQRLYDKGVSVQVLRAKKTDDLHLENLRHELLFRGGEKPGELDEINARVRSLLLEQNDYIGVYLAADGVPLIRDGKKIYASYLKVGKGMVITMAPFDFKSAYHDGEIFRLALLNWALENRK